MKIEKSAVLHSSKSNFAYAYDENTLKIVLRTKLDDLKKCELYYSDPFDGQNEDGVWQRNFIKVEMKKTGSTTIFDYWGSDIEPKDKRATYFFKLTDQSGNDILYTERGFYTTDKISEIMGGGQGFSFPWMNKTDIFKAPDWIKNTIWYQIFPERFANGDKSINPKSVLEWGKHEPTPDNFFGGDLQGIIDHLDHLKELGINGLYLCPIFKASSNHKYDTTDYLEIDPNFGDKKVFKKLVDECHKRGIKIMLDAVFNHIGYYSEIWQDVVNNQEKSKYKDWFHIKKFPVEEMKPGKTENYEKTLNYHTFAYTGYMPKINTENEEARNYLLKVAKYWVEEFGIDAWRLDVANEVDHNFWRDFRKAVNSKKPIYILGEIWSESNSWLRGDQFDGVMNYYLTSAISDFVGSQSINALEFKDRITEALHIYPKNVTYGMFNCLDSHDTARLLHQCKENVDRALLSYSVLFTLPGAPSIYYGDEIGMSGANDPGCRKCMEWDTSKWNKKMFEHMKLICKIRSENPTIGSMGELKFDSADKNGLVIYTKFSKKDEFKVVINNSEKEIKFKSDDLKGKKELFSNSVNSVSEITMPQLSMKIFKIN